MNDPRDKDVDLVGYLLGALDADEQLRIDRKLEEDPELRHALVVLDAHLHDMRGDEVDDQPPRDLVANTCDRVADFEEQRRIAAVVSSERAPQLSRWSFVDLIVAGGICLAISLLFFPVLLGSRHAADLTACQDNLRALGVALSDYSEANRGYFPAVPPEGNLAVAGYYAPALADEQLLPDAHRLICPSSPMAERSCSMRIPTSRELLEARGEQLLVMHRTMGGSYAYTLGYVRDGRYCPTKNLRRCDFVLMADAPSRHLAGRRSANHAGRGQNVLFEDFHVQYVVDSAFAPGGDGFYENRIGMIAAGVDVDDAVVGDSATSPLAFRGR